MPLPPITKPGIWTHCMGAAVPLHSEPPRRGSEVAPMLQQRIRRKRRIGGISPERRYARRKHIQHPTASIVCRSADALVFVWPAPVGHVTALPYRHPPMGLQDAGPVRTVVKVVTGT